MCAYTTLYVWIPARRTWFGQLSVLVCIRKFPSVLQIISNFSQCFFFQFPLKGQTYNMHKCCLNRNCWRKSPVKQYLNPNIHLTVQRKHTSAPISRWTCLASWKCLYILEFNVNETCETCSLYHCGYIFYSYVIWK